MFQIACYRIERAMSFEILRKNLENENLIFKGLIYAVDMHRKAMKFSTSIVSKFQITLSLLIIIGVISATLNIFRIFQMVLQLKYDAVELAIRLLYNLVYFSYLLIGNYIAQEIIDLNNNVFITVYNVQWYIAPLQIQKMILFVLQRSTKAFNLNIAGLFVGSLEGAATVKCLLEQLQHNCDELIDENEINIMKQYAINAKRYTAVLIRK
ncbi:PREDICTED: uncharacterized protein LOC105460814 [Wasmannia auropunctata]|uniref:uncharacterized protein LOC105460814 n=1 Tax=Wasmannia auropunctata TaxID=64793 RepID=UPI0005EF1845|nr:PREDICTED: uncharacterized protein LOC105460814 [Wasmannia auropunctata]